MSRARDQLIADLHALRANLVASGYVVDDPTEEAKAFEATIAAALKLSDSEASAARLSVIGTDMAISSKLPN